MSERNPDSGRWKSVGGETGLSIRDLADRLPPQVTTEDRGFYGHEHPLILDRVEVRSPLSESLSWWGRRLTLPEHRESLYRRPVVVWLHCDQCSFRCAQILN